jgi:hypothetical protein
MAGPWVAPDSQAEAPPAPVVAPLAPASVARQAPPIVPIPLRPFTIPDILDGALRIWKLAPATIVGMAAVFVVPIQVTLGIVTRDDIEDAQIGQTVIDAFDATGPGDVDTGFGSDVFFLSFIGQGIALAFVTAGVASLVSGWYVGHRATGGELARVAARRAIPLVAAWVLVHVVEGLFMLLLFVPVIVPFTWYAVVTPIVACERAGPLRAMRRSMTLCGRRFGAVLGTGILVILVDVVLSGALTTVAALYVEWDLPAAWAVNTAVAAAALLITLPFVAGVSTLVYLDLRVRTEGLDIELAADKRFPVPAG